MQAGKIDVWNKIKQRAAAMDVEAAQLARRQKEAAARRRKEMKEVMEWSFALVIIIIFAVGIVWGGYELMQYCQTTGNCRR